MSTRNGNMPMMESPLDLEKLEFPHLCEEEMDICSDHITRLHEDEIMLLSIQVF